MDDFDETLEELELLIGRENAKKVVGFFEGMNIYFPKRIGLNELHNRIFEELRNGAAYHDAAVKYGYTKSHIRKIEHKIQDKRRRERQTQKPEIKNTAQKPEPHIRLVPRETAGHETNVFEKGELFYGNGS